MYIATLYPFFKYPYLKFCVHTFKWISAEEKSLLYTTKLYCIDDLFCCWEYDLLTMRISTEYNICFCCGTVVWLVSLNINLLTLIFLDFAKFTVLRLCNFVDSYILVNKHVWCNFLCHFPSINLLLVANYFMYRYFNKCYF